MSTDCINMVICKNLIISEQLNREYDNKIVSNVGYHCDTVYS